MAKMTRSRVEEIVANELPGYRVLPKANNAIDARLRQQPEASSPEIAQLMKKFQLDDEDGADWAPDQTRNGGRLDDEIELVQKIDPADPLSRGNRPKAKVLSPSGTIKGSQG